MAFFAHSVQRDQSTVLILQQPVQISPECFSIRSLHVFYDFLVRAAGGGNDGSGGMFFERNPNLDP